MVFFLNSFHFCSFVVSFTLILSDSVDWSIIHYHKESAYKNRFKFSEVFLCSSSFFLYVLSFLQLIAFELNSKNNDWNLFTLPINVSSVLEWKYCDHLKCVGNRFRERELTATGGNTLLCEVVIGKRAKKMKEDRKKNLRVTNTKILLYRLS